MKSGLERTDHSFEAFGARIYIRSNPFLIHSITGQDRRHRIDARLKKGDKESYEREESSCITAASITRKLRLYYLGPSMSMGA